MYHDEAHQAHVSLFEIIVETRVLFSRTLKARRGQQSARAHIGGLNLGDWGHRTMKSHRNGFCAETCRSILMLFFLFYKIAALVALGTWKLF